MGASSKQSDMFPRGIQAIELTFRRRGEAEPRTVRLTRREVPFNEPAAKVRPLAGGLGYVDLPAVAGLPDTFEKDAVAAIRVVDAEPRCGWVVDLRRNFGGNMWPMIHAIRPILGAATPGYFVSSAGRDAFSDRYGRAPGEYAAVYQPKQPDPPVAVLTSRLTSSSGEALAISFRGRPSTRSFGEATFGVPTSNQSFPLADGAVLVLTTMREADRTGHVYDGPIAPDQVVEIDWTRIESDSDPVLLAAMSWLHDQPRCAIPAPE
jgi:carboxyl-terminal processing protease